MDNDSKNSIFRQESLERLSSPEQLDQLMQIVTPRSWLSLSALGALVMLGVVWSIVGRIPMTATGKGILVHPTATSGELVGLAYFDREQSERIQPGMEVMIAPGGSDRGGILGRVKTVVAAPVTTLEAARQLGTSDTSDLDKRPIEVLVELERDRSTPNTTRSNLSAGMTISARVLLTQKAPIAFAFPFFEASP
jgi:hypothetical protein